MMEKIALYSRLTLEQVLEEERFDPARTVLTLSFVKKVAEKSARKKASGKK